MCKIEKFQSLIVFAAVILGILIGKIKFIESHGSDLIIPFLFAMLFGIFINIPFKSIFHSFMNYKFSALVIFTNFIWSPFLAWSLGKLFLSTYPILWLAFILLMVTPCIDWYLVFTGIAKGNLPLSLSILPINLFFQITLLPLYLFLFSGNTTAINLEELFKSIFVILILPFSLAGFTKFVLNHFSILKAKKEKILQYISFSQIVFLALAIMMMFASQGKPLISNLNLVYILLVPIVIFYFINLIFTQLVGKFFKLNYEDSTSLTITSIAKNSPMTLGIVILVFPNEPLIPLAMVIEPLIELPCIMLISQLLLLRKPSS